MDYAFLPLFYVFEMSFVIDKITGVKYRHFFGQKSKVFIGPLHFYDQAPLPLLLEIIRWGGVVL